MPRWRARGKIILAALGNGDAAGRDFLETNIFGIVVADGLAPAGDLAQGIGEHTAVDAGGQAMLGDVQPLGNALRGMVKAGKTDKEVMDPDHTDPPSFTGTGLAWSEPHEPARQPIVRLLKGVAHRCMVIICQPQNKTPAPNHDPATTYRRNRNIPNPARQNRRRSGSLQWDTARQS